VVQSDTAREQFEKILKSEAPSIVCPEIASWDTPEAICDQKFGAAWFDNAKNAVNSFVERFEQRRVTELSDRIDSTGQQIARIRRGEIRKLVDNWVWSGPRGWAKARSCVNLLCDEAAHRATVIQKRISQTTLPPKPDFDRIQQSVADLRGETERRPRAGRAWSVGLLLFLIAVLFGYAAISLLKYPLAFLNAPVWSVTAVQPPLSAVLAAVVVLVLIAFTLRAMITRRHKELLEVKDSLERCFEKHLTGSEDSLLAYYLARLELKRDLWLLRLVRAEKRQLRDELARLEDIQRALDTLWRRLHAEKRGHALLSDTPSEPREERGGPSDLLLREIADPPLLDAVYCEAISDENELSKEFIKKLSGRCIEWRQAVPMASLPQIGKFLDEAVVLPNPALLLSCDGVVKESVLKAFGTVLIELATRLSWPLGLTEAAVDSHKTWVISAPVAAAEIVDEALSTLRNTHDAQAIGANWTKREALRDDGSIYLAVYVTHLPSAALQMVVS
jgi:hypothetical protein